MPVCMYISTYKSSCWGKGEGGPADPNIATQKQKEQSYSAAELQVYLKPHKRFF